RAIPIARDVSSTDPTRATIRAVSRPGTSRPARSRSRPLTRDSRKPFGQTARQLPDRGLTRSPQHDRSRVLYGHDLTNEPDASFRARDLNHDVERARDETRDRIGRDVTRTGKEKLEPIESAHRGAGVQRCQRAVMSGR